MIVFLLRYDKSTGEGRGIVHLDDSALDKHIAEDPACGYLRLSSQEFHHLQSGCHVPPHHHRVFADHIVCKKKIDLKVDKYNFEVGGVDKVALTWEADKDVHLSVNAQRTSDKHKNNAGITASYAGQFRVEIDDPDYYSEPVILNAEEPDQDEPAKEVTNG